MEDLKQIDAEIAICDKEIAALEAAKAILLAKREEVLRSAREAELPALLAKINELGFTKAELGFDTAKAKSADTGPKKYRNPETGKEWSGKGNEPKWIKGKDRNQFLNPEWSDPSAKKETAGISEPPAPEAPTTQSMALEDSTAQDHGSATASTPIPTPVEPAIATIAPVAIVAAASVSGVPAINANVASGLAVGVPIVDTGHQPIAAAA